MAFIRPPEVEGGERATASLAYGWDSELGAISEVLAEPAPCKTPVRSTRIRGAVTRAEGACGELPCPGCICMGRVELAMGSTPLAVLRVLPPTHRIVFRLTERTQRHTRRAEFTQTMNYKMRNITTTYIKIHSVMRTIKPQNVIYRSTNPGHDHTQYKIIQ